MDLHFDATTPAGEQAGFGAIKDLVERFGTWLGSRPDQASADPADIDLILRWKLLHADGDLGWWGRDDVDELLLDHLPRKLSAPLDIAASIPDSLAAYVRFLDDVGLLDPASDPAEMIATRISAQRQAFLDAMTDPSNFGMAKRLLDSAGLADDGLPDEQALAAAMAEFDALPFDERGTILGLDGAEAGTVPEMAQLPFRPLASIEDLDALAGAVPLVRRVDALWEAVGPGGVKLTKAGNPTLAVGRRLVEATGVGDRVDGIRSSADLPRLFALATVAQEAGAVEVASPRLRHAASWADESPGSRWQLLVDATLDTGAASLAFGANVPMPLQLAELADQLALHMLAMLWMADEPVPSEMFVEVMQQAANLPLPSGWPRRLDGEVRERICRDRVNNVLDCLCDAGLVVVGADRTVSLTDAGPRLAVSALRDAGFGVLTPEDLVALDAAGLVDALLARDADQDETETISRLWAAGRGGPTSAAHDLVAQIADRPEPARVMVAFSLIEPYGADAVEALRTALDTPVAGHAWLLLATLGAVDGDDVPPDLAMRAGVDLFMAMAEIGTPADVVELVLERIPAHEQSGFVDAIAASDHDQAPELLQLLAHHHPDQAVARHARKAALRTRR